MRVLNIVAHPDDEVLGLGAVMANKKDWEFRSLIICGQVEHRTRRPGNDDLYADICSAHELLDASFHLGHFPNLDLGRVPHYELVKFIEEEILAFRPDYIFTHHLNDLNDDHGVVAKCALVATSIYQRMNEVNPIKAIFMQEILSSTDWNLQKSRFTPNVYFPVLEEDVEAKWRALSCYRNVGRPYPHSRSRESIFALAKKRGVERGFQFVEAFELVNLVL